jgi:glutathione S-transferase
MVQLCGFEVSNYYNKVKLALLEKGVEFEQTHAYPSSTEAFLADSPMGKVPFIKLPQGTVSESQAIIEYLEDTFPQPPLYPSGLFERAKCRELIHLLELYLELPARRLYPAAFFGGSASEETRKSVQSQLAKGMRALARLVRFEPFIAGTQFTYADCAAVVHLPLISSTCKTVFGEDVLAPMSGLRDYLGLVGQRPHVQRVNAERKAGMDGFLAHLAKLRSGVSDVAARSN